MTNPRVLVTVALVAALALTLGVSGAAAADEVRGADLVVEQPHYAEGGVQESTSGGTPHYTASGGVIRMYPEAFSPDDVVESGVEPGNASLSETSAANGYQLEPQEAGTYDVYWIVTETVERNNDTVTRRIRYEASVEVTGGLDVIAVDRDRYEEQRNDAEHWQELNASVSHMVHNSWIVSMTPGQPSSMAWVKSALEKQQLVHNPTAALTGGLTMLFFGIFSLGGGLVVATFLGWHAKAIQRLRKEVNEFEMIETEESDLNRRFEEQAKKEKRQSAQNMKFTDIFPPHTADAMRSLGDTPLEADSEITSNTILPSLSVAFTARAMGADGHVGVLPDDTAPDGGEKAELDTDEELDTVRASGRRLDIVKADEVDDDAFTVDLTEAERDWIDVLPINDDVMLEYRPVEADIDREAIQIEAVEWTVEDIMQQIQLDQRHFDSAAEAATYFQKFVDDVVQHPMTDFEGRPRTRRVVFETFLQQSQLLDDKFGISKTYITDMLEAAIADDDPVEDGMETIEEIRRGEHA